MKNLITYLKRLYADERGSLQEMTWLIGGAVVVVLVIIGMMVFVPDTVEELWNTFISYAKGAFGL